MDTKTYMEKSAESVSDNKKVDLRQASIILLDSFDVAYTGAKADMLKRLLFYGDKNSPTRYEKAMAKNGDLYDKLYQDNVKLPFERLNLFHSIIGLGSEVGELHEALTQSLATGEKIDRVNIIEEVGDLLWYIALMLREVDSTFEEAMEKNILKLKYREENSKKNELANKNRLDRDLDGERKILEGKSHG